jgi:outer membrane protein OmpA-like peptidoglycan-associated protein
MLHHFFSRVGVVGLFMSYMFLVGCSTPNPDVQQFSSSADAFQETNNLETNINKAAIDQVNILSPNNFAKANEYLTKAKEARRDNKSNKKILEQVALGNAWLLKANDTAKRGAQSIPEVVDARARALDTKGDIYDKSSWETAEKGLAAVGKNFEDGNFRVTTNDKQKLLNQYVDVANKGESFGQALANQKTTTTTTITTSAQSSQLSDDISLDEQYKAAKEQFELSEADVLKDNGRVILRLRGLNFKKGKSQISPSSYPLMTKVQTVIKSFGDAIVDVEGHTDSTGSKEINIRLSEERADAVRDYLLESGAVDPADITAAGFGDEQPINTNRTKEGRMQNRRVDIVITPQ